MIGGTFVLLWLTSINRTIIRRRYKRRTPRPPPQLYFLFLVGGCSPGPVRLFFTGRGPLASGYPALFDIFAV